MKMFFAILLALTAIFVLLVTSGCGGDDTDPNPPTDGQIQTPDGQTPTTDGTEPASTQCKIDPSKITVKIPDSTHYSAEGLAGAVGDLNPGTISCSDGTFVSPDCLHVTVWKGSVTYCESRGLVDPDGSFSLLKSSKLVPCSPTGAQTVIARGDTVTIKVSGKNCSTVQADFIVQ